MSDDENFDYWDNDIDEKKHNKIVENVLSLNKAQNLKKPSRTEPTLQISEFNLVKSITGKKGSVQVDELTKVLKSRKKHVQIGKKLESTNRKSHTLPKPLEKPQAERIRRSVGYERNRFLFDRWEAFVSSNRAQAHQVFPLDSVEKIKVDAKEAINLPKTWKIKSDLQKKLEKLDTPVEEFHIEDENNKDDFPLTLQELKEKRNEAAKLRAHQSFKEAKARKQNKIKSKKYHRILRKERIKQKLKEFEDLQKTNPEEALKKLEEIEKARALERFSLRHKSTGQWAKSKQFRAKYDKESRQVLAQQLHISRELTQKLKNSNSDSDDEGIETEETSGILQNDENPWVSGPKPDKEVSDFVSGYKKFWSEQITNMKKNKIEETESTVQTQDIDKDHESGLEEEDTIKEHASLNVQDKTEKVNERLENKVKDVIQANKKLKNNKRIKKENKPEEAPISKKKKKQNLNNSSGNWDIDEIFDHAEKNIESELKKKLKDNQKTSKVKSNKTSKKSRIGKSNTNKKVDLSLPSQSKKQIIDEEMLEIPRNEKQSIETTENIEKLKNILGEDLGNNSKKGQHKFNQSENIDPEKFMNPKTTNLDSALPDLMVEEENTEDNQKNIIMEAFEDNDIVQDFTKEKQEELDKDKPKDIDLNLPGWGSWAGTGINPKKQRKRKRFIVKMPEVMPRRDDNKGTLIINEKAEAKIKPHLVSEIPFPFKTVKDYEASIRAPIGNTFVPELAFRKYIRPAVETKMGTIIEPVTTSILMGKTKSSNKR